MLLILVLPVRERPVFEKSFAMVGGHDDEGVIESESLLDEAKEPPEVAIELK